MEPRTTKTALIGGLVLLALMIGALPAQAQSDQRCFAETGFCISGRIQTYWEQNGGLPVFGLPLEPEARAVLADGSRIASQLFERNRLEVHSENAAPYDVLLGRVGADLLERQNRNWRDFPKADGPTRADTRNCQFFAETEHSVCGEFLAAFRAAGLDLGVPGNDYRESLALFGLPLSEPMTETIEGKQYQVQWFERARFELHPELPSNNRVLFGRLGAELTTPILTPLSSTVWQLVSFGPVSQQQTAVAMSKANPQINFGNDGRVSGSSGCNSFGGSYTATASQIAFGRLVSTLRACGDEFSTQEREIYAALQNTIRYERSGSQLRIFYNQDQSVLTYALVLG